MRGKAASPNPFISAAWWFEETQWQPGSSTVATGLLVMGLLGFSTRMKGSDSRKVRLDPLEYWSGVSINPSLGQAQTRLAGPPYPM